MPAPAQVHIEVMILDRAQHITAYAYGTVDKSQGVLELLYTPCADRRTGSTWTFIAPQVFVNAMAFWSSVGKGVLPVLLSMHASLFLIPLTFRRLGSLNLCPIVCFLGSVILRPVEVRLYP